jgi:hypothetical protein
MSSSQISRPVLACRLPPGGVAITAYGKAEAHMLKMANMLRAGLTAASPGRFTN